MKAAFTICSNNYLARAKVVGDSFAEFYPNNKFFIILVDKYDSNLEYNLFQKFEIIQIQEVFSEVEELSKKYNIIELCTSVKPSVFSFLFEKYSFDSILYLDPDLQLFDRLTEVEEALDSSNLVLTPHFCSPIDDGKYPSDVDFIKFGIFNLGFLAVKNTQESDKFLTWWHNRLMKYGFDRPHEGMFTDQLWLNYALVFFDGCSILKHPGYNMANWNLYERRLSIIEQGYLVNSVYKLKFYHFSHYQYNDSSSISRSQNRYALEERKDLQQIYNTYHQKLTDNKHCHFFNVESYYNKIHRDFKLKLKESNNSIEKRYKQRIKRILNIFSSITKSAN